MHVLGVRHIPTARISEGLNVTGFDLFQATGLTPQELSEVFQDNPRAYMAVRGAVSEKHLAKVVERLLAEDSIDGYKTASGDMDKDFYLQIGDNEISVECKNVEVIKTGNKQTKYSYIEYLSEQGYIASSVMDDILNDVGAPDSDIRLLSAQTINEVFKRLPQKYRESGLAKYEYSASQVTYSGLGDISDEYFLAQFDNFPITIDFQRTRNSTDDDGDSRRNRYYRVGEIDIVGACLFSRTMEWKFLFAKAEELERHREYPDRYSNKVRLRPGIWTSDLVSLIRP